MAALENLCLIKFPRLQKISNHGVMEKNFGERSMDNINKAIWTKFRVKHGDTLPFVGWSKELTRIGLAQLFGELGYKKGVEIGVQAGIYSEILCQNIPDHEIFCVDPWGAYNRQTAEKSEVYYNLAVERLEKYNATLIRMPSMQAVKGFDDNSLDFIYIDGMHEFDPVMLDLICWSPKVRPGGIVAGHDFCNYYQGGVIDAVKAYTLAHNIWMWYVTRDREPSFFWVKQ